jgi:hypothetical protein
VERKDDGNPYRLKEIIGTLPTSSTTNFISYKVIFDADSNSITLFDSVNLNNVKFYFETPNKIKTNPYCTIGTFS